MDPFTTSMHSGEQMSYAAPGLRLTDVSQTLSGHAVFSKLSLRLKGQSWHCILGRSGVGKTTLLRLIAGLDAPQGGRITDDCERPLSAQVSYMSQDDGLLPWLSVVENVQLGPRLRRESTPTTHARAIDLLSQVDLLPWADATTDQLSGGMRQRVALARTLLEDRPIVLMDEPFPASTRLPVMNCRCYPLDCYRGEPWCWLPTTRMKRSGWDTPFMYCNGRSVVHPETWAALTLSHLAPP